MLIPLASIGIDEWGVNTWSFIHSLAQTYRKTNYTDEQRTMIVSFFQRLDAFLPCGRCQKHYQKIAADVGTRVRDVLQQENQPDAFVDFVIDLHNTVNASCGKPVLGRNDARMKHNALVKSTSTSVNVPKARNMRIAWFGAGFFVGLALALAFRAMIK